MLKYSLFEKKFYLIKVDENFSLTALKINLGQLAQKCENFTVRNPEIAKRHERFLENYEIPCKQNFLVKGPSSAYQVCFEVITVARKMTQPASELNGARQRT